MLEDKFVPTQQGLDDWMAQLYGYNIGNIPSTKPN